MGIITGLQQIEQEVNKASGGNYEKAKWLKMNDGQSVKIHFLQELDKESPGFNPAAGEAIVVSEHSNPDDYMRKASCTHADTGSCYGCEQNAKYPKTGWRAKLRFYANVLVDDGKNDPYVAILSQGVSEKAIMPSLMMFARDSGSITQCQFRIARKGTSKTTTYSLVPIFNTVGVDPTQFDLFDLKKSCVREVPYEEQEAFYSPKAEESEEAPDATQFTEW